MKSYIKIAIIIFMLTVLISCVTSQIPPVSENAEVNVTEEIGKVPERAWLDQGWDNEIRNSFWYTSQGSQIIPYDWFTWLERADSTEYFRSVEHMEQLRYLPMKASKNNPSGLPIGFALNKNQKSGENWVGMTCAACHTNQLDYGEHKILIEGAPTLANFVLFYDRLVAALNATNMEQDKFDRFAKNVLAGDYNSETKKGLHKRLSVITEKSAERQVVNDLPDHYAKDFTSYGRLDAFGNIQNAGSAFALHDLNNNNAPTAPVSYPFLWGTHQSDVVQWNASAPNTPIVGPLVRNIGEVVGVFGGLEIEQAPFWQRLIGKENRYFSTVDMMGLGKLESWVKTLRSPGWPQQYLPAINTVKAAQGAQLYQKECTGCHQVIPRAKEGDKYIAIKTPVSEIGTDPATAKNAAFHMAKTLLLEGTKSKILVGDDFKAESAAISIPVNGVVGVVLKDPKTALKAGLLPGKTSENEKKVTEIAKTIEELVVEHMAERKNINNKVQSKDADALVYKARPLNGIWATAPYLHNGSVPSLWELLKAPDTRTKSFWVGSRDFDPINVGYQVNQGLSEFKVLDGSGKIQLGNSNLGHVYGTSLKESEKWALIEYMKTL